MRQVPVLLITGFLGSGKTTFLNWLIQKHPSRNVSIILNEFGDVKLESQFIEKKDAFIAELPGGCMCCIAKSDIPHVVHLILDKSPQTEYILIEASGLSDPTPIRSTLNSSALSDRIFFDKTVAIVDSVNFEKTKDDYQIIMAQISDSDLVLLSKTNEAGKEKTSKLKQKLELLIDDPVVEITDELDPSAFLTAKPRIVENREPAQNKTNTIGHDKHDQFHKLWFETEKPLNLHKFQTVMHHLPDSVVRAKGFIKAIDEDGTDRKILVQYVNGRLELFSANWEQKQKHQSAIVLLGKSFDKANLNTRLHACED